MFILNEIFFQVLEDLIVALKIVPPDSQSTSEPASTSDENKENIIQHTNDSTDSKTTEVPMDVETTEISTQNNTNTAETVDMVSDVDCSISENDWSTNGSHSGLFITQLIGCLKIVQICVCFHEKIIKWVLV